MHTGVAQATSNVEVSGPVVVKANDTTTLSEISFFLQLAAGGASVDMTKVTFTVSTTEELKTFNYTEVGKAWYVNGTSQTGDGRNDMLDKFEMVKIMINRDDAKELPTISTNGRFTVEVKPDIGAALPINRIAPADFQANNYYEVY